MDHHSMHLVVLCKCNTDRGGEGEGKGKGEEEGEGKGWEEGWEGRDGKGGVCNTKM